MSASRVLGAGLHLIRSPHRQDHKGVRDYRISCVLRACDCRRGRRDDPTTPGSHVVRDTAHNEQRQTIQIGVFTRGIGPRPGGVTVAVFGGFELGYCKWSPHFSRFPAYHPRSTISLL